MNLFGEGIIQPTTPVIGVLEHVGWMERGWTGDKKDNEALGYSSPGGLVLLTWML